MNYAWYDAVSYMSGFELQGGHYPTSLPMTLQIRCINLLLKPGKENLV